MRRFTVKQFVETFAPKHVVKQGWGFWDVTHYPYGGSFRRATQDLEVTENLGPAGRYPQRETKVKLADGSLAIVPNESLEDVR